MQSKLRRQERIYAMPKVSVLIPIYNAARYLRQCLDSVCGQTLREMEIICINDGSTDDSPSIIREYAAKDSRIIVIDKPNSGYGHSMNVGIEAANGVYIGIVESDDFVEPEMFEELYQAALRHHSEIVKSNFWFYWENRDGVFQELFPEMPYEKNFAPCNFPSMFSGSTYLWTGIYQKQFLVSHEITFHESPGASFQDVGFTVKAMACAQKMQLFPKAYYHYRQDNAASSIHSGGKVFCVADEFKEVWKYLSVRREIMDKVKYAIPPAQFQRLTESFARIDACYRWDFIDRAEADFKTLREAGVLKREYWAREKWEAFRDFRQSYCDTLVARNHQQILLAGLWALIAKGSRIYIYGAGIRGKKVFEYLHKNGLSIEGFVVTEKADTEQTLLELPIMPVDHANFGENGLVLIAIKAPGMYEAMRELEKRGITNYIAVDDDLYKSMREGL